MKKLFMKAILVLTILIFPYNVYAISTTTSNEKIDLTKDCILTIYYNYDDKQLNNIPVKVYNIASVTSEFQYQLSSNFSKYPIKINGITTNEEWNILKNTLKSYIIADNIQQTELYSIQNNTVEISHLTPGLYFIKTEKIDTTNDTLLFDSFLISIPNLTINGSWNYNVSAYPKAEERIPKYEKINYTIMKQWLDYKSDHPQRIEIEIYKDGVLMDRKTLSSKNNWTYQFETYDDGSEWTVVERNIPTGYHVSILNQEKKFIIINTNSNDKEENPKTFDDIHLYFYLFIGSFLGIMILVISLMIMRKKVK